MEFDAFVLEVSLSAGLQWLPLKAVQQNVFIQKSYCAIFICLILIFIQCERRHWCLPVTFPEYQDTVVVISVCQAFLAPKIKDSQQFYYVYLPDFLNQNKTQRSFFNGIQHQN